MTHVIFVKDPQHTFMLILTNSRLDLFIGHEPRAIVRCYRRALFSCSHIKIWLGSTHQLDIVCTLAVCK